MEKVEHTIPGFEIERLLGRGGTGAVYLARQLAANRRPVALKVLPFDGDATRRSRFELEARVGALLDHPDIIDVYETGVQEAFGWIAMEVLDGFELSLAMREPSFELSERIRVLTRVALALQHAHEKDVIHRDVKPSNIFLTRAGGVKLLDFGIARVSAQKITKTGYIVGTPQYMSPEQISGLKVDARADVFSLGVVAFELLSGQLPWEGENHTQIMMAVCSKPPRSLRKALAEVHPELPEAQLDTLVGIVHKAIRQEPGHRYATAQDLANALQAYLRGEVSADAEADGAETDPEELMQRRIEWAIARAARLRLEQEVPSIPSPRDAAATVSSEPDEDAAEERTSPLWVALLLVFALGLGVVLWLALFQGDPA